jgi:dihydroorotate dehydrogenase electron transfer subunit
MMKKLLEICKNVPFQASLERYMKCGFGICGQCTVGKGLRVCEEGPVFDGKTLKNIEDFGFFKRDATGRKIRF